jgi:hypothetical protein
MPPTPAMAALLAGRCKLGGGCPTADAGQQLRARASCRGSAAPWGAGGVGGVGSERGTTRVDYARSGGDFPDGLLCRRVASRDLLHVEQHFKPRNSLHSNMFYGMLPPVPCSARSDKNTFDS